jgi:hypothetical protein
MILEIEFIWMNLKEKISDIVLASPVITRLRSFSDFCEPISGFTIFTEKSSEPKIFVDRIEPRLVRCKCFCLFSLQARGGFHKSWGQGTSGCTTADVLGYFIEVN